MNREAKLTEKMLSGWWDVTASDTEFWGSLGGNPTKHKFSTEDIETIAASYDPDTLEAPVKFGHADEGESHGWIDKVRAITKNGKSYLQATLKQLSDSLRKALLEGRYRSRSAEVYINFQGTGKPYLGGLAFLGAGIPAMKGLSPLPSMAAECGGLVLCCGGGQPEEIIFASLEDIKQESEMPETLYLKSQESSIDTGDNANILAAEITAGEIIKAAESEAVEAKERYQFAISIDDETSRKEAWDAMQAARQKTLNAKEDLLKLRAYSQESVSFDNIQLVEAAIAAAEGELKNLDGDKIARVERIIGDLRLSLQQDANEESGGVLFGNETRMHAFAALHKVCLTDDRGFALFASSAEVMAKKWIEDMSASLQGDIDLLRKGIIQCSDPSERKQIQADLESAVRVYDAKMQTEIVAIMLDEGNMSEVAQIFMKDRAEYNLRKKAGFNTLLKG